MEKYKFTAILACFYVVSGCGTMRTNFQNDVAIKRDLRLYKTNCAVINRVYSGVSYDACKLNSRASGFDQQFILGFYVGDLLFSGALDTLFLPFTLYKQNTSGAIEIK